jgi:hypothetical protein
LKIALKIFSEDLREEFIAARISNRAIEAAARRGYLVRGT